MIKVIIPKNTEVKTKTMFQDDCGFIATNVYREDVVCLVEEDEESLIIFEGGYGLGVRSFNPNATIEDWCEANNFTFIRKIRSANDIRITIEVLS